MTNELMVVPTTVEPETRDNLSRVPTEYESLNVEGTKEAYSELNSQLEELANTVVSTIDRIAPYLASMQALLSQRGSKRKKILKKAGLPTWSEWVGAYCSKLDCSFRTVQRHIKRKSGSREQSPTSQSAQKKTLPERSSVKLDGRQQAALVKAQLAANDLVSALKNGADWQTPLAEYERVAITPTKLDGFLNTLAPEPDWKNVLSQLVIKLEQVGDRLPLPVLAELKNIQPLMRGHAEPQKLVAAEADDIDLASSRGYIVEERLNANAAGVHYAVVHRDNRKVYDIFPTENEAEAMCQSLNTSPVFCLQNREHLSLKAS